MPGTGLRIGSRQLPPRSPKCASDTKPLCQATASTDDQKPKVVSIGWANSAGPQTNGDHHDQPEKICPTSPDSSLSRRIAICVVLVVE